MQNLPVYLLIDTSGSMQGEPIEAVNAGLQALVSSLRRDSHVIEIAQLSIITFDREAKLLLPLTPVKGIQLPLIETSGSGPTMTGAALELVCQRVDNELKGNLHHQERCWKPLLFIMTDGSPSDIKTFKEMVPECKRRNFASIIACAAGVKANIEVLNSLADKVFSLETCDSNTFSKFFSWVSSSISSNATDISDNWPPDLPPPPDDINKVL